MAQPKLTDRGSPTVVPHGVTVPQRASRLPSHVRFPILVALYGFINWSLLTVVTDFLGQEMGKVSRSETEDWLVVARVVYRVAILYFTWMANYDWIDASALTVLTNAPYAYLLSTYYDVSPFTVGAYTGVQVFAIAIPTLLLRPTSKIHNRNAALPNRFLLDSFQVQTTTAILAIGVYTTVLWVGIKTSALNVFLVSHFDLPTLEGSYAETPVSIFIKLMTVGLAAKTFLLNPSIGVQTASDSATPETPFDPSTATLAETLRHNFWFFSKRTRTLITQTAVLSAFLFANTLQKTLTLRGSQAAGAAGYAGVWLFATWVTAGWWAWIGDTES